MSPLIQALLGLIGGLLWLLLLVATDFNTVAVGLGLLVAIAITR